MLVPGFDFTVWIAGLASAGIGGFFGGTFGSYLKGYRICDGIVTLLSARTAYSGPASWDVVLRPTFQTARNKALSRNNRETRREHGADNLWTYERPLVSLPQSIASCRWPISDLPRKRRLSEEETF
jgi:hypothetical protein